VKREALVVVLAIAVGAAVVAGSARGDEAKPVRICADPDNLPFSNQKLEGFENRIAELVARDLGRTPTYFWWPHQRGLVRNTLAAEKCDLLISIPRGWDPVLWTKPYYRSAYVLVFPRAQGLKLASLDAPELRQLRIGVYSNTPPEEALARRGMLGNLVRYSLFFDAHLGATERPTRLFEDLMAGKIDVGVAWGPMAGYFARTHGNSLELVPLASEPGVPLAFDFSMGVRKGDQALKGQLEAILDRRQAEIRKVLEDYGVPLLPVGAAAGPPAPAPASQGTRSGS
jgi:mxaJ protein